MKMFKKFKNKKSAALIKTKTMTQTATALIDQNKLDTSVSKLAMPDSPNNVTLDAQSDVKNPSISDEKSFLPEKNNPSTPLGNIETTTPMADTVTDKAMVTPQPASTIDSEKRPTDTIKPAKIKLTGRMLNFTRLHITGNDFEQIRTQCQSKFGNQPNSKMLVVLSCEENLDLARLLAMLWEFGLQPIGIVTGKMDDQAVEQKLAIFPADGKRIDVLTDDKKVSQPKPVPTSTVTDNAQQSEVLPTAPTSLATTSTPPTTKTEHTTEIADSYISSLPQTSHLEGDLIYTTMLRSGQSINHVGGDLVLTQGINAGAEAITDYSLHVYGKAEGRLVAGATGDENARIFCLRFNPSLVSVAGTFCLRENIPSEYLDKAVQVRFERDKGLIFTLMNG